MAFKHLKKRFGRNKNKRRPRGKHHFSLRFFKPRKKQLKTRVPRSSRSKEFPLIRAMNLKSGSDNVPSSVASDLAKFSASDNGAVREVTKPDGSKAFTVIAISEQDLEDAGLTTKSDDLASLSASMRKHLAYATSMVGDLDRGIVTLAPTENTLEVLHEYDELKNIDYHWALFDRNVDDNAVNNTVTLLDNTVTLAGLDRISRRGSKLSLTGNKIVSDTGGKAPKPKVADAGSRSDTTKRQAQASGSVNNMPNVTLSEGSAGNNAGTASQSSSSINNLATLVKSNSSSESEGNSASDTGGNEDPFGIGAGNEDKTSSEDSEGSMGQDSTSSANPFGLSSNSNQISGTGMASNVESADKAFEKAEKMGFGYQTHGTTRKQLHHEHTVSKPTQSPSSYSKQLNDFMGDTYNDTSLDLKIDLTDLKYMINRHAPMQFTLKATKPDDELGRLINQRRIDLNQNLKTIHYHNMTSIYDWVMNTMGKDVALLNKALSPNNKHTMAHSLSMIYDSQYKSAQSADSSSYSNQAMSMERTYNSQKSEAVERRMSSYEDEYDSLHNQALVRSKQNLRTQLLNKTKAEYLDSLNKLKKQRIETANQAVDDTMPDIISSVRDQVKESDDKEAQAYDEYEHQLIQLAQAFYQKEASRKQAIAQAKSHDHKLIDARRNYQAMQENYRRKIHQEHQNAKQDIKTATSHANEIAHQTRVENRELNKRMSTIRRDIKRRFQDALDFQKRENGDLRQKNDDERQQLLSEFDKSTHNMTALREQNSNRNKYNIMIGIGAILVIGGLATGIGWSLGHGSSHYHSHVENVQSSSSSTPAPASSSAPSSSSNAPASSSSSKPQSKKGNKKVHHSKPSPTLMTKRPSDKAGYYIATSTSHKPTSYTYVTARGNYQNKSAVRGMINNHAKNLTVVKTSKNRIVVRDPSSGRSYEFNK